MRFDHSLRYDQQPERYIYMTLECRNAIEAMPGVLPSGENPDPEPYFQVQNLFNHFCAGGVMVHGYHHEKRRQPGNPTLFQWKTWSVRTGGYYISKDQFLAVGAAYKKDLKGKSKQFYAACAADAEALGFSLEYFLQSDPHGT